MGKSGVNIGKEIQNELLRQGHSVQWLSQQLGCNRTNIYNIFMRDSIATDLLMRISIALNKDFFALFSSELAGNVPGDLN
ncbi:MAG: XRE family transcriptional regulator [Muribaculaceae bacterium]|nr:XRE family transcriptional regulator [Muribaculaceae bacterium]